MITLLAVGVALNALFALFILVSALVVWHKVFTLFQAAETHIGDYLPVTLGGIVFLTASGMIYHIGTSAIEWILKAVAGG